MNVKIKIANFAMLQKISLNFEKKKHFERNSEKNIRENFQKNIVEKKFEKELPKFQKNWKISKTIRISLIF